MSKHNENSKDFLLRLQITKAIKNSKLNELKELLTNISNKQAQGIIINKAVRDRKNYQGPQSFNLLEYALKKWKTHDISEYLIKEKSFSPNLSKINTSITSAINFNAFQAIDKLKFLKENNFDIDIPDEFCMRPIHHAIAFGNNKLLDYLIKNKAKVDRKIPQLNQSIKQNEESELGIAYEESKQAYLEKSPLEVAVEHSNNYAISILLKNGANLEDKDKNGNTILHKIAMSNNTILMNNLIKDGYITKDFLQTKNKFGQTPLDIAKQEEQKRSDKIFTNQKVQELLNENKLIARASDYIDEMQVVHTVRDSDGIHQNIDRSGNRNRSASLITKENSAGINLFNNKNSSIFLYDSDNAVIRGYSLTDAGTRSQYTPAHLFYNLSQDAPKLNVSLAKISENDHEFKKDEDIKKMKILNKEYHKVFSRDNFIKHFNEGARYQYNEILVNLFPDSITGIICSNAKDKVEGLKAQYFAAEKYGYDLPIFQIKNSEISKANIQIWNPTFMEIFQTISSIGFGSEEMRFAKKFMLLSGIIFDEKNLKTLKF